MSSRQPHLRPVVAALAALVASACAVSVPSPPPEASSPVTVTARPTPMQVACSGASCGAASPTRYAGSGVGIWRYRNDGTGPTTFDLFLEGLPAGAQVALVFTNGTAAPIDLLPSAGTRLVEQPEDGPDGLLAAIAPPDPAEQAERVRDAWQQDLRESDRAFGQSLRSLRAPRAPGGPSPLPRPALEPLAPPAVGDHWTWTDLFAATPTPYDTVALEICTLPGGRRAVFWVDPRSTDSGTFLAEDLAYFRDVFCGQLGAEAQGGFARATALLGDVFGPIPSDIADQVISDTPRPQDLNIAFVQARSMVWAGYFSGFNCARRAYDPSYQRSNEALVFFVDIARLRDSTAYRGYLASTLLHELTHMINFFQRQLLRGLPHDTWLEEVTATMTEDLLLPAVTPDHSSIVPAYRVRPYLASGGAISLVDWGFAAQNSYALGGTLAAFLDRQHGTAILSGSVDCTGSSIDCLDRLIADAGGGGFEEALARAGASSFALLPLEGTPLGYGYPEKVSGDYRLAAIDVLAWADRRPAIASPTGDTFQAASHTYLLDTMSGDSAIYLRADLVVPPGASLTLVVQPAARAARSRARPAAP